MIPVAGFEHRLDSAFGYLLDGDDWKHQFTNEHGSMHIKSQADEALLAQYTYEVDVPLDKAIQLYRPEAWCVRGHPFSCMFENITMLKSFSPGDIICSVK